MENKNYGGKRRGAGRPSKDRKRVVCDIGIDSLEKIKAIAKEKKVFPSVIIREIISNHFEGKK